MHLHLDIAKMEKTSELEGIYFLSNDPGSNRVLHLTLSDVLGWLEKQPQSSR